MRDAEKKLEQSDFSPEDIAAVEPVSFDTEPQTSEESNRSMQEAAHQFEESEFSPEDIAAVETVDFD